MKDALDVLLSAGDLAAVLGRELRVTLVEISTAGCLLESTCRLEQGAIGLLRVWFEEQEYFDDVRVTRCQKSEGSSGMYRLGGEFLWTTSPHERSLRRVIARLQSGALRSVSVECEM